MVQLLWSLGLASLALSAAIGKDSANDIANSDGRPKGYVPRCNHFYRVQDGDTCWDIISQRENTLTIEQLMCWNPDINPGCSNLIPGHTVCVGVANPGPLC